MKRLQRCRKTLLPVLAGFLSACSDEAPDSATGDRVSRSSALESASETMASETVVDPERGAPTARQKSLAAVIAGSWDAVNLEELDSAAKRITMNFGDEGTCEIVVRMRNAETVHQGRYEVIGDELKIEIPDETVTSSYDGDILMLTDKNGETVKFKKLP